MIGIIIFGLLTLLAAGFAYSTLSKYLLIKNTAPQRIRSVSQGFAQLHGRAEPITVIETPISRIPAVAFRLEIYHYVSSGSGKDQSTKRETIVDITHAPRFMLKDDTASILIDAPREQNLFRLLRPSHFKEYTIGRGGFFDQMRNAWAQSKGVFDMKRLSWPYAKALMDFRKSGDYTVVEDAVSGIVSELQKSLESFEPAAERGRITWGNNKLYVTERAILPNDEITVLGSVSSQESAPIVTKGKEGTFLIGSGDEAQVLRGFRWPMIGAIAFLLVCIALLVLVITSGGVA
ncbi:MAG: hypothetical protein ACMXYM_03595 [Candidatus Woesearchaeota archaeon]